MSTQVEIGQNYMTLQKTSNIAQNINSRMSVQVSLTGLSFLLEDLNSNDPVFFIEKKFKSSLTPEELLLEIESVFSETEELRPIFEDVTVVYATNIYTTVPRPLFEESKASEYLKFNTKILSNDFVAFDTLETHEIIIVYVPFVNINNYFFDRYGTFQFFHGATIFLKNVLRLEKHTLIAKMYLHVIDDQLDCIVVKNGGLQLCNSYPYKTPEDFIYYVLFCLEQLHLNPDTIPVFLCGDIEKGDSNYEILYTYIRSITFIKSQGSNSLIPSEETSNKNFLINSLH